MNFGDKGSFVISLDFELYWGVKDHRSLAEYGENILGARIAIPRILALFDKYNIHATWATVGFLFFNFKKDLLNNLPIVLPIYKNPLLSNYNSIKDVGEDESLDPYHFGLSLIHKINSVKGQEIGSHTFSHYYCLEDGQTIDQFREDLKKSINVIEGSGLSAQSIVFPRNQYSTDYLKAAAELGFKCYRGTESSWLYSSRSKTKESKIRRLIRLVDAYLNISGHHTFLPVKDNHLWNIQSSRFLRPYSPNLAMLEKFKVDRIKNSMRVAAESNQIFHLWWHPHNFGLYMNENLNQLEEILIYYKELEKSFGFASMSMGEIVTKLDNGR